MSNLVLFVCGIVVTLISGLGVLVYMVSVGYDQKKNKTVEVDIDLGAAVESAKNKKNMDSFVGIPSVS